MGIITGLATIGFLIFLAILVVYCCCRVRRKRSPQGTNELPEASPYRQTCHPSSPSILQQNTQTGHNPYFMEGSRNPPGQTNFLNSAGAVPGSNYLNPHQSTVLYPTTSVGVPHQAVGALPYPVNASQGMPMPVQMPMPQQNYVPNPNPNFQPSAPLPISSGNDQPPPYHTVVTNQNPYQPYKFP